MEIFIPLICVCKYINVQMEEETLDELDEFIEEHELSISFPHLLIVHPFFGSRLH